MKESSNDSYLDAISKENKSLIDIHYQLDSLSRAFRRTGNEQVSDELYDISIAVKNAQENINGAVGKNIHDQLISSNESTTNMLKACLAGSALQREESRDSAR